MSLPTLQLLLEDRALCATPVVGVFIVTGVKALGEAVSEAQW